MEMKSSVSFAIAYATLALIPLHAEESAPAPQVVQVPAAPIQNARIARSTPKTESRTVAVAELENIRLNLAGTISFRETNSGITYRWMAPSIENRQVILAAVLEELRKAEKVEMTVYSTQEGSDDKERIVTEMILVYKSLK